MTSDAAPAALSLNGSIDVTITGVDACAGGNGGIVAHGVGSARLGPVVFPEHELHDDIPAPLRGGPGKLGRAPLDVLVRRAPTTSAP